MRHSRLAILVAGLLMATGCMDAQPSAVDSPDIEPLLSRYGRSEGFRTTADAQARLLVDGELIPLATAGDVMPGSRKQLVGIPDGIGSYGDKRYMRSYMNHEISGGSYVSNFTIDTKSGTILDHDYTIEKMYNRLCSASWNDAGDGFPGGYFFTGEESTNGAQLAIDRRGNVTELPWIGYYAHEQQIAVPGFTGKTVVVNFDDDGSSSGDNSNSELFMYVAHNTRGVLSGKGQLYTFTSDEKTNVGDMVEGETIEGYWIPVPEEIALDPSDNGSGRPPLNDWVDDPEHDAFDFTRLEDGFYDKVSARRRQPAMYFFDTGDPDLVDPVNGEWDPWGSIYRMAWKDRRNPAGATSLTLLARSDGPTTGWASPDNGDMNADGVIMLQEDPAADPWGREETRIYAFQRASDGSLANPAGEIVVETVGSQCNSGGFCWETSGIEDASRWFGENSWIFDVQSKRPAQVECPDCVTDGQLLIMKLGDDFGFRDHDHDDEGRHRRRQGR